MPSHFSGRPLKLNFEAILGSLLLSMLFNLFLYKELKSMFKEIK
jgi:hypothetical protein